MSANDGRAIIGEAATTVHASPAEIIEFVLDLERYRQADRKIGKVGGVERHGDRGTVRFRGRIRGLPGPWGTYPFEVTPNRLVVGSPVAGAARGILDRFEASFEMEPVGDRTRVTHREVFIFKRPWAWIARPLLGQWLRKDITAEMTRLESLMRGS
jgi:hypothetical protein